jgi:phosphoribosylformylglycinamidine (FGAM) synthase-like amidotransferase family enzyme
MTISWAFIYEHPGTDPVADRHVVEREGMRTVLVPVSDPADAPKVATDLIDEGIGLIELCGGFSLGDAAKVAEAVQGRIPVGHVTFAVDSVRPAAAYSAAFDER